MTARDRLVPWAAGGAVVLVALIVVVLLRGAVDNGVHALEEAKLAQVETTADSFDARVLATFDSLAGLSTAPWQLTPDSAADKRRLRPFDIDPEAAAGNFLLDREGRIVNGTLLRPGQLGSAYEPREWTQALRALRTAPAALLPVQRSGVTTPLPAYAVVVALRQADGTGFRGFFVLEGALTPSSAFSKEIRGLAEGTPESGAWRFLDSNGVVVATTLSSGLGEPVPDERLRRVSPGLHDVGHELVVSQDVPSAGWRVLYTESRSEFAAPLVGPVQTVGLIVVLLLLLVGLVLTVLLARRLRQAREEKRRLLELHRSQEEFVSVVSHELRTPVAGVLGFLQTSLDHWESMTDAERHNAVRRAFVNARRLQAMTRDVLDTESIESGRFGYVYRQLDLAAEIRNAAEAFDGEAPGRIVVDLPDSPVQVSADADRLQQVFTNLLENAIRSAPPDTSVGVSLRHLDGTARVTVTDYGSGIAPEHLERIFDKFVRGRENTVTGTGLGLYISRRIVEAHDGRIWAESGAGEPTRFVVELPSRAAVGDRVPLAGPPA